ncbi:Uncharacterized protein APZ42_003671, partial [Daphnia magna]
VSGFLHLTSWLTVDTCHICPTFSCNVSFFVTLVARNITVFRWLCVVKRLYSWLILITIRFTPWLILRVPKI